MLSEFETIERTLGAEKAGDLRKALHFLLRRQFVFAGDPRTATVYHVLMDGRFRAVIDGFFDSCGYRVRRDTEAQWAGITALGEDVPLPKMKLATKLTRYGEGRLTFIGEQGKSDRFRSTFISVP